MVGKGLLLVKGIKLGMGELLLVLLMPLVSAAFNLDTDNAVVYQVSPEDKKSDCSSKERRCALESIATAVVAELLQSA